MSAFFSERRLLHFAPPPGPDTPDMTATTKVEEVKRSADAGNPKTVEQKVNELKAATNKTSAEFKTKLASTKTSIQSVASKLFDEGMKTHEADPSKKTEFINQFTQKINAMLAGSNLTAQVAGDKLTIVEAGAAAPSTTPGGKTESQRIAEEGKKHIAVLQNPSASLEDKAAAVMGLFEVFKDYLGALKTKDGLKQPAKGTTPPPESVPPGTPVPPGGPGEKPGEKPGEGKPASADIAALRKESKDAAGKPLSAMKIARETRKTAMESDLRDTQRDLTTAKGKKSSAEAKIKDLEDRDKKLKSDDPGYAAEKANIAADLGRAKAELTTASSDVGRLEAQEKTIATDLAKVVAELKTLKDRETELDEAKKKMKGMIDQSTQLLETLPRDATGKLPEKAQKLIDVLRAIIINQTLDGFDLIAGTRNIVELRDFDIQTGGTGKDDSLGVESTGVAFLGVNVVQITDFKKFTEVVGRMSDKTREKEKKA